MTGTEQLTSTLKKLRLSGILETLDLRSRQATDDHLSHSQFLYRLLCDEVERRDSRQLDQRLRRANFESLKTLEDFDWRFNLKLPLAARRPWTCTS
jgi:DNA replication protein DnaC